MKYINNKDLIPELEKMKLNNDKISEELGKMFYLIARNLSNKSNYISYTWKQDMVQEAVFTCVKYIKNFNLEKSRNPFAYITTICNHSFIAYIKKQKKHSVIKDTCYKEIAKLEEQKNIWVNKSIDYTILVKDRLAAKKREKKENERIKNEGLHKG